MRVIAVKVVENESKKPFIEILYRRPDSNVTDVVRRTTVVVPIVASAAAV